jgi:hypothetical protein
MLNYFGHHTMLLTYLPKFPSLNRYLQEFDPEICLVFNISKWHYIARTYLLPGIKIYRPQGSDVLVYLSMFTRHLLNWGKFPLIYASEDLKKVLGLPGYVIPTPIDTTIFKDYGLERTKDVLYYCRNDRDSKEIYQYDRFMELMKETGESYTIVGPGFTYYSHHEMPMIYNTHRKLIRFSIHDANPKMPCEALLCGCEVYVNGNRQRHIPEEMLMEKNIPKWEKAFQRVLDHRLDHV